MCFMLVLICADVMVYVVSFTGPCGVGVSAVIC